MNYIKNKFMRYLEHKSAQDPAFANNKDENKTQIETALYISYGLKTYQMVVLIANSSYILGMLWLAFCECLEDYYLDHPHLEESKNGYFIEVYGYHSVTPAYRAIAVSYWAFTTLSTVGFGDIAP